MDHAGDGWSDGLLACWNDTPARQAIVDFVSQVVQESGANYLPPTERIAVFDNDGTLWCEKPMPVQLGFILQRLAEMAEQDPSLRARQPWQAARENDCDRESAQLAMRYRTSYRTKPLHRRARLYVAQRHAVESGWVFGPAPSALRLTEVAAAA